MKEQKFELADQVQVFELESVAEKFFADILSMNYSEIMITDESWLSDFAPYCGEDASDYPIELRSNSLTLEEANDVWFRWVNQKIEATYDVSSSQMRQGNPVLFLLFRAIQSAQNRRVQ